MGVMREIYPGGFHQNTESKYARIQQNYEQISEKI